MDILLAGVTEGSEKLYDGLPASSLDGQALAVTITDHLARPAIPSAPTLLRGLCAAAGLCLDRAAGTLRDNIAAVERSRSFWRAMLDGLPGGCRAPLSSTCHWRRRAHCKHQGRRLCLGEPPWQPKSANAAVAVPRHARASRGASSASASATSRLCGGLRRGLSAAASAASTAAAALRCAFCSSSASSRERASQEPARRDVPAACARACRLSMRTPAGGRGPHHRCPARTSTTVPARLYSSCLYPGLGYLQFSCSSATTACASDTVADLRLWAVARR